MSNTTLQTQKHKMPQYSLEAEQSVLGGIILSNEAWDVVIEILSEGDFYLKKHKILFRAIRKLISDSTPVDLITLSEYLEKTHQLSDIGGNPWLFELVDNTPSSANIKTYASIVRDRAIVRELIGACTEIIDDAFSSEGKKPQELLDSAESKIFRISDDSVKNVGPQFIKDILKTTVAKIDELMQKGSGLTGVTSGFRDLDEMTSGLQPSDLIILAGRPSMGKTVLGVNIAEKVALYNPDKVSLVFSLEMPAESIVMRLLSSLGGIDQTKIRNGSLEDNDWPKFTSAVSQLSGTKLFIDDSSALSPSEVRARARRVVREHGEIGVIVIDYLQLMRVKSSSYESRAYEISEISRSLKALAKELNVPIIALSQLNRELEKRINKRPVMSDLRESGAIEQDADVIGFIYRDAVYNEDSEEQDVAEVIIGKQRNGPIGTVKLKFQGQFCRFDDLVPDYYEN